MAATPEEAASHFTAGSVYKGDDSICPASFLAMSKNITRMPNASLIADTLRLRLIAQLGCIALVIAAFAPASRAAQATA